MKALRKLPAIHELQKHPQFLKLQKDFNIQEEILTEWLSAQVQRYRDTILHGDLSTEKPNRKQITADILANLTTRVHLFGEDKLQKVINATGVVLHTNLGRARLSEQATRQMIDTASYYSTLEYDLHSGERGSRHEIVEGYLKELTSAEAAIVVNNNAAAVYFILKALAAHEEVIVSRGELIEIGGSFRISEIMEESSAELISVGTTNKTYVADYEQAITENTALLMKVHKSNFATVGFTDEIDTSELVPVAENFAIPIYEDLGSGTLFDFTSEEIGSEPTIQEKVQAGIDLISFSGDKLLGGPQAGIIVGKQHYIERLKEHQLARVLRVDKFTLAALEATLKTYIRGDEQKEIPTVKHILASKESILKKAQNFIEKAENQFRSFTFEIKEDISRVGGGTMPAEALETYVVLVKHQKYSSTEIAEKLRDFHVPIIVRLQEESVLLDFRTVNEGEIDEVIKAFADLVQK